MSWFGRNKGNKDQELPQAVQDARAAETAAEAQLREASARRAEVEREHGIAPGKRPAREPVGEATERLRTERGGRGDRGYSER